MSAPDDELQKIFKRNREEIKQNIEDLWHKEVFRPLFLIDAPLPSSNTQKVIVPTPSGTQVVDTEQPIENFQNFKPGQSFRDFLIENNGKLIVEADEKKAISNQRDLSLEKNVWQQKIQPISEGCFNGAFQYDLCPGVAELTNESIALVHNKIFQIFNKLIEFPVQLNQMAPCIDQGRRAKELIVAFDDIVLKKFRAGLVNSEKNELFFDFIQDVYDCNLLPVFLTYIGHCCNVTVHASKGTVFQKRQSQVKIHTPTGTTWGQIRIRYVNDNHVEIAHPIVGTHAPYSMVDLGLDSKPTLAALFKLFAKHRGDINNENMGVEKIKANISNLRKHLKAIFPGIQGAPIADFSKQNGYRCHFKIS